jgi:hypothetical protein
MSDDPDAGIFHRYDLGASGRHRDSFCANASTVLKPSLIPEPYGKLQRAGRNLPHGIQLNLQPRVLYQDFHDCITAIIESNV